MRKLLKYFLIIVIIAIAMPPKQTGLEDLIKPFNIGNAINTYYTTNAQDISNASIIQCGSAVFVQSNLQFCDEIKKNISKIDGQSITFSGDIQLYQQLVTKLLSKNIKNEAVGNVLTCYGYNNALKSWVNIDNNKINIQIAINNNQITIGTPVILGSY